MSDPFASHMAGLESPASDGFSITPSDVTDLPSVTRALYVGGGGDVAVTMKTGASLTLKGVPAGTVLAVRLVAVADTGTTATHLVGLS
ncbi:MAG: hypothetical protein ACFB01_00480 [Cohaesibacteraceae bacterium]